MIQYFGKEQKMIKNIKISKIIRDNFISKISYFSNCINKMKILETEKIIRVDSSLPSDTFNICVIKKMESRSLDMILDETVGYFNEKLFPAAVWFWIKTDNKIIDKMEEKGFKFSEKELGMYIPIDKIKSGEFEIEDFTVKEVSSKEEMEIFGKTLGSIFGSSGEAVYVKEFYRLLGKRGGYKDKKLKFYIGLYNGEPVSTGTIYYAEESTGIYDISTKESYRKKGFGTAMFDSLLSKVKEEGSGYCILQASSDGAGIYKSRGFIEAGIIEVYENRNFLEKQKDKDPINRNK